MQTLPASDHSSISSTVDLSAAAPSSDTSPAPAIAAVTPPIAAAVTGFDPALPPILVADDDADDQFYIQRLIKKTGVKNRVITFDDGTEVVNYLDRVKQALGGKRHHEPLLLFLDLKMVGLGGFGFLEWARQQRELAPLKIVVLTNSSEPQDMQKALELGAHRYLVKYPSVATFATIVHSVYPVTVF
jgi:CheY-like chemotaxis protein